MTGPASGEPVAAGPPAARLEAGESEAADATAEEPLIAAAAGQDPPWQRLAIGMLLVEPVREIIRFIPLLIVLLFAGRAGDSGPPWGLIGTAAVVVLGISRWLSTRYRITATVVEVRRGLVQRKHLTVPRDRVRTVDISAHPLQRLLGLVKVQIGTGTSHHLAEALTLDGLRAAEAAPLRADLLHRSRPAAAEPATAPSIPTAPTIPTEPSIPTEPPAPGEPLMGNAPATATPPNQPPDTADPWSPAAIGPPAPTDGDVELARLRPRWIGYAPATLSGFVTAAFLIGLGWRILNEARLDPRQFGVTEQALRYLRSTPVWLDVIQITALVLAVVTVLSVAGYVLSFWGFRLSRHPGGTLQVSRGLLTTRATSIEERRLHGVERSEPLLLRWAGGARLQAIATGLRSRGSERGGALLVPPAPLTTVTRVETIVLGTQDIGRAPLASHGPAARRRRFIRAIGAACFPIAALWVVSWWARWPLAPAIGSLVLVPLAALVALDRYRNLGHAVVDGRLITRFGSLVRRRQVLAVPGVIGLTLRQSYFQRRAGLFTLTATTAAGNQHYDVPDVPAGDALGLAVVLLPDAGLFLTPSPPSPAGEPPPEPVGEPHPTSALLRDEPGVSRLPG
jgi:putative membrane protein